VHDPYNRDFLALESGFSERRLEDALVARLTHFLAELGEGFAFVGRRYRLTVGEQDFFADLLFFHSGCAATWSSSSRSGPPPRSTPGRTGTSRSGMLEGRRRRQR